MIGDLCNGELFKEHSIFSTNPNALQIVAYFDEVELANPLGSKTKKNKIGIIINKVFDTFMNTIQQVQYISQLPTLILLNDQN